MDRRYFPKMHFRFAERKCLKDEWHWRKIEMLSKLFGNRAILVLFFLAKLFLFAYALDPNGFDSFPGVTLNSLSTTPKISLRDGGV